jgi:hypothetical protein
MHKGLGFGVLAGVIGFMLGGGSEVWAAIPSTKTLYVHTLTAKKNRYVSEGVFTGGTAGTGATVLGVRRLYSPKAQIERVVVDLGNKDGRPSPKSLSYFQASVDPGTNRIVLDLAQLQSTSVTEPQLKALFKKSAFVSKVEFTLDPEDKTGSMVLQLKRPAKLEVFQLLGGGKPARVVMDMVPVAPAGKSKVRR